MQGVFVRRHQIDKEDGTGRLTPVDLAVGQTVTVYGRTFVLIDADVFTRNWWVPDVLQSSSLAHSTQSLHLYIGLYIYAIGYQLYQTGTT